MQTRLAWLYAIMAFMLLSVAWLVRYAWSKDTVVDATLILAIAVIVMIAYWCIGWLLAKVGVDLIHEVFSDVRAREEARRDQARRHYLEMVEEAESEGKEKEDVKKQEMVDRLNATMDGMAGEESPPAEGAGATADTGTEQEDGNQG